MRAEVDLLPGLLADICDVEVTVFAIEREAPGITEAVADDLPACAPFGRIDPEQLAQPLVEVLRTVPRIALGPAVAHADVEQPIRAELQLAAVVIRIGLTHEEELPCPGEVGPAVSRAELDDARITLLVCVIDVEQMVFRIGRTERNRQQAALAPASDSRADVEQRSCDAPSFYVANRSGLLHDVETIGLTRRGCDERGALEAGDVRPNIGARARLCGMYEGLEDHEENNEGDRASYLRSEDQDGPEPLSPHTTSVPFRATLE